MTNKWLINEQFASKCFQCRRLTANYSFGERWHNKTKRNISFPILLLRGQKSKHYTRLAINSRDFLWKIFTSFSLSFFREGCVVANGRGTTRTSNSRTHSRSRSFTTDLWACTVFPACTPGRINEALAIRVRNNVRNKCTTTRTYPRQNILYITLLQRK